MRKKTYLKAKNVQNFHRHASLHDSMFKLIHQAKVKAWVYRQLWQSFYRLWPYQSFRKLNSTLKYITISVYLSPGSCSRSAIRYQNSISKHRHRSSCYSRLLKQGKILHPKGLRGLCIA